jgi:hypothetical protein
MCFVWISEQTAIISLYNTNWLVFITETECVYCAVRTVFMCFVWISEQTAIISLYNTNWLVCRPITETECVYCAVRAETLSIIHVNLFYRPSSNTYACKHLQLTMTTYLHDNGQIRTLVREGPQDSQTALFNTATKMLVNMDRDGLTDWLTDRQS